MKEGVWENNKSTIDDQQYSRIELEIDHILKEGSHAYRRIFEIIKNPTMLRIKSSSNKTPLWYIARHADFHLDLLKMVLHKYGHDLSAEDFAVSPNTGAFQNRTVIWLIQFAPIEIDVDYEKIVKQTIHRFDQSFAFYLNYSNIYLPSQNTSRTEPLGIIHLEYPFEAYHRPEF